MNSYRLKKERERLLLSSSIVLSFVLLVILTLYLFNLLKFETFEEYTGPVKITFGSPDSLIEPININKTEEQQPKVEEVVPIKEVKEEIIPDVKEKTTVKEPEVIKEKVTPPPEITNKEVVKETPKPVEKPVEPVIQKGRESGNSHETSFESNSSKISRSAYFPIYHYMPLPKSISMAVFSLIEGDITGFGEKNYNRNLFKKYYFDKGTSFSLTSTVPFSVRPELWAIIENAGYDLEKAEYKVENKLKPIIISFVVNSNSNGKNAIISAVIEESSGNSEVDESVLYGFKQGTYSNSTNDKVKGRFKYSFK